MIKFGIIGPGRITHRFIKGINEVDNAEVVAVASRSIERAQSFAALYDIEKAYGSYADILNDQDVDAIYLATPNATHHDIILECLKQHKHVLCEKPIVINKKEAEDCYNLAKKNKCLLMEASKGVFTPTFNQIKMWLNENKIGKVLLYEGSYCYHGQPPKDHWIYNPISGGGLFDVGIYPLVEIMSLTKSPIIKKQVMNIKENDCAVFTQLNLQFEDQSIASIRGAINVDTKNCLYIYGEKGYIECSNFWKSKDVTCVVDGNEEKVHFDFESEFAFEIRHFATLLEHNIYESPILNSTISTNVIEIIEEAIKEV